MRNSAVFNLFSVSNSLLVNLLVFGIIRMSWLRKVDADAEKLFSLVAEVFIFWAKSHVSKSVIFMKVTMI